MNSKRLAVLVAVLVACGGGATVYAVKSNASEESPLSAKDGKGAKDSKDAKGLATGAVLATINGRQVYEAEIAQLVQSGVDRSVALDRRITQNVLANAAEKDFSKDAKILMEANRADILAQLYMRNRLDAIRASITDKDIAEFYKKNVLDEDYRQYKLKTLVTADAKEAQTSYEALAKGKDSKEAAPVLGKMQNLSRAEGNLVNIGEIPYNLGQVVKKMKAGEAMQPVVVREGILVMFLEEVKENPKPTLEKTKEEIRGLLVSERIGKEVQDLRKAAKIELKG